ncbi:MAG: DUF6077 domain-containing protein [Lachnospiraceae bacterium]
MLTLTRIALFMGVMPYLTGIWYTHFIKEEKNNVLSALTAGYMIMFGLFEILALPMIFWKLPLSTLMYSYTGLLLAASLLAAILERKRILSALGEMLRTLRHLGLSIWIWLGMVCLQIVIYIRYAYSNADDAFYIASANTSLVTNTIFAVNPYTGAEYATLPSRYVLSPFHAFIAVMSKLTGVHPAILSHSVMMILFLLLAYAVYILIGRVLFQNDMEKLGFFLILITSLHVFAAFSERTAGLFFLIRLWQGKAIVAGIILPFVLYLFLRMFFFDVTKADWILLFFTMSACSMVSSMGIILGAISVGIFGLLLTLRKLNIRYLIYSIAVCSVNLICSVLYLVIR